MKKSLLVFSLFLSVVLLTCSALPARAATATIVVENKPHKDRLVLNVGESYTFNIHISSDEPFVTAIALSNAYYPGRGIFFTGNDTAPQGTEATLQLTVTGKASTADLAAVTDWPTTEDWPAGVAPAAVAVGVRFANGEVIAYQYSFGVVVP